MRRDQNNQIWQQRIGMFFIIVILLFNSAISQKRPNTVIKPISVVHHGIEVIDNYRWLENNKDSEVLAWDSIQNDYLRVYLENLSQRETITQRLQELTDESSPEYYSFSYQDSKLFAKKRQPPKEQSLLITLKSPFDLSGERVVLDPNELDKSGLTAIDFYQVSPDAKYVAVSLSKGGTEDGDVYVYEVETGKQLADFVPGVNGPTAGGDIAWKTDGSGFYYTRYPRDGERPANELRFYQQVYFHTLGEDTSKDKYIIGEDFPKIAEVYFETSNDFQYIIIGVANGDGGEYAHYLLRPVGKWRQVTRFEDKISTVLFAPDNSLYLLSNLDASRGEILHLAKDQTELSEAEIIVPESEAVIRSFLLTDTKLYIRDMLGGPSKLRVMDLMDNSVKYVDLLPLSSIWGLTHIKNDRILFTNASYTVPQAVYQYDPSLEVPEKTAMVTTSSTDFSDVEVLRDYAISKDGTRIPMNIIRRKGTELDGSNPTILYGYGGYGSCETPWFDRYRSIWLENGFIYVTTNIRGGGEFGEEWHLNGNLLKKQNVFDDFTACAQHLIDKGYTSSSKLAIMGGSNGGLLVGATMTQHPTLFRAVVCLRGVLDMLRFEFEPNGAFNVTEFGSTSDPDQFQALYAYSPYHHIEDGVRYPDVLFTADVNDNRVSAGNSRKMVAIMQKMATPETLVLLRTSTGSGHGIGRSLSARLAQKADYMSFLFDRLGARFDEKSQ